MSTTKKRAAPKPPQAGNGKSPADNGHSVKVSEDMDEVNGNGGEQSEMITLKVVLPDQSVDEMSVSSSTPLMDLRMQLCAKYKLSPSFYALEPVNIKTGHTIPHQPSSTLHSTSATAVAIKSKQKEPPKIIQPKVVQQTVRLTVKMSRSRQQVLRVSPNGPISDMMPQIFSKSGVKTEIQKFFELRHPDQHDMALDTSRCLDDYKIREAFLADKREVAPTSPPPTTPTTKKSKKLKSFFRLSSKKRLAPKAEAQDSKEKSVAAEAESNPKSVPAPKAPPRSKVQAPVPAARTHVTGKKKAPVPPAEAEPQSSKERPAKPSRKQPERPPAPTRVHKAEEEQAHQEENTTTVGENSEQAKAQSPVPEPRRDVSEQDGEVAASVDSTPEPHVPEPVVEKTVEDSPDGEIAEDHKEELQDYKAVEALDEVLQQEEENTPVPEVDTERRSPSPVADERPAEVSEVETNKEEVEEPQVQSHGGAEEDRVSVEEAEQTADQADLEQAPKIQPEVVEVIQEKLQQESTSQEENMPPAMVEESVRSPPPDVELAEVVEDLRTDEVTKDQSYDEVDGGQSGMVEEHVEMKNDQQPEENSVSPPPEVLHQEEEKLPEDDLPSPPPDLEPMAEDSQTATEELPLPDADQAVKVETVEKMMITEEMSIDLKTDEQLLVAPTPPPTPVFSVPESVAASLHTKEETVASVHQEQESEASLNAEVITAIQENQSAREAEFRHNSADTADSGISSPENTPQASILTRTAEKSILETIELPELTSSPPPEKVANDEASSDEEKTLQEIERLKAQINRIRHKKASKDKAEEEAKKKPYTILTEKRPVTDPGVPKNGAKTFTFVPNQRKKVVYEDYDSIHLGVNFSQSGEIKGIGADSDEEVLPVEALQEAAAQRNEAKDSSHSEQSMDDQRQNSEPSSIVISESPAENSASRDAVLSSNASDQVEKPKSPGASKSEAAYKPTVVIREREEVTSSDIKESQRKSSLPHYYKRFLGMNAFSKPAPSDATEPAAPSKTAEKQPAATSENAHVAKEAASVAPAAKSAEKQPPFPDVAPNGNAVPVVSSMPAGGLEKEVHIISSPAANNVKPLESAVPVTIASPTSSKAPKSPTSPVTPSFYGVSSARPFKSMNSGVPKFRPVSSSFKVKSVKEVETKPT